MVLGAVLLGTTAGTRAAWSQASQADETGTAAGDGGQGVATSGGGAGTAPDAASGETSGGTGAVAPLPAPATLSRNLLPATAETLPVTDTDAGITGNLSNPPADQLGRPWTLTPSITIGEEYTDNVLGVNGAGAGSDVITLLQPGLQLNGDTSRVQGSVSYNPAGEIHALQPSLDRVDQQFDASLRAALVPDVLFVDLRGFGADVGNGVAGPGLTGGRQNGSVPSASAVAAEQATQTYDISVQPYVQHRFATLGTGELGLDFEHVTETPSGSDAAVPATDFSPFTLPGRQDANTFGGHAAFRTGDDFGRYSGAALADLASTSGTGVLASAARDTVTLDNGYAVTRNVVGLLRVGYEYITYAGTSPVRIDDAIWDVGIRLFAVAGGTLEVRYGHHDGFDSATLDAAFRLTARTRFYARYSEGLNTATELLSNALETSDPDTLGVATDRGDGAPLLLADGFFGSGIDLYRTRLGSASLEVTRDRDVVTFGVQVEDNRLVSAATPVENQTLNSNSGAYGTVGWTHEWTPTLSSSAQAEFGIRRAAGAPEEVDDVGSFSLAFVKQLTPLMSAQFRYDYERVEPQRYGTGYSANLVVLSVTRTL